MGDECDLTFTQVKKLLRKEAGVNRSRVTAATKSLLLLCVREREYITKED